MTGTAVCLMGPTASGKTDAAVSLCERFPFDVISVDSALVYRGMDIGTAKPDAATLAATPHRLIDIRDPEHAYSAGDFVRDARREMRQIFAAGRVPLLVGGTMMYFRALTEGIATLPSADADIRAEIDAAAANAGWPALHAKLARVDAAAAANINPNDSQRIQRALEVFMASGRPLSELQRDAKSTAPVGDVAFVKLALRTGTRQVLHKRIEQRLHRMWSHGFLEEVQNLMQRPGLTRQSPSMRAVGYRQLWSHLAGECSCDEARGRALAATRQLAKRQLTWLRAEPSLESFDPLESNVIDVMSRSLAAVLGKH